MAETAKAHARRVREGFFDRYVKPPIIDIGAGDDPLTPDCAKWDIIFGSGDAAYMDGSPNGRYQTVFASHILEHLDDPVLAVRNWYRLLRPSGHLIISVPHMRLYEKQEQLPSRWNLDHKTYWLPTLFGVPYRLPHWRGLIDTCLYALGHLPICRLSVEDTGHTRNGPSIHSDGEYSIDCVLVKL